MTWDWQVFLQDTGGGQTYLDWMISGLGLDAVGGGCARWWWRCRSAR